MLGATIAASLSASVLADGPPFRKGSRTRGLTGGWGHSWRPIFGKTRSQITFVAFNPRMGWFVADRIELYGEGTLFLYDRPAAAVAAGLGGLAGRYANVMKTSNRGGTMRARSIGTPLAIFVVLAGFGTSFADAQPAPVARHFDRLRSRIEAAMPIAQGMVGVSIKHLESGVSIAINGDGAFPMASTFKLPVLVEMHAAAKAGTLRWDERVEITPHDQHLGSGDLTPLYDPPGVALSMRNLANLMMMISDNSAADICLAKAGAERVTARMRSLGIQGIRVDRSCQELILDFQGHDTANLKGLARDDLREALRRDSRPPTLDTRFAADDRMAADPRDTATPNGMLALLEKIWQGQVVDRAASDAILDLLKRCRTGENRLRGLLPSATVVAHKTGTLGGTVNDVGVIYLPGDAGHVAIAVMSRRTRAPLEDVERTIAHIARYAYDYFLFTADAVPMPAAR